MGGGCFPAGSPIRWTPQARPLSREETGYGAEVMKLVGCWDLNKIQQKYSNFVDKYQDKLSDHRRRLQAGEVIEPGGCFVERFHLIHEYRKLPFYDPDLPIELLPKNWLRPQAASLFNEYHDLLANKANEYFDSAFQSYGSTRRTRNTITQTS